MNELSQSVFENLYNFKFQDFLDQLKADKERKKALWKVDIELRRQSEEGGFQLQFLSIKSGYKSHDLL